MYVLPMHHFLALKGIVSHQELLAEGRLVEYRGQDVIFVSHQWCSPSHPDPNFEQLPVLQQALRNMGDGKVEACGDLHLQLNLQTSMKFTDVKRLMNAAVWYDYFSLPFLDVNITRARAAPPSSGADARRKALQPNLDLGAAMAAAARSVPAYI